MSEKQVMQEIKEYKRINSRNNKVIIALVAVLIFVLIVMFYVRFFG